MLDNAMRLKQGVAEEGHSTRTGPAAARQTVDQERIRKRWAGEGRCICKTGDPIPCHRALSFQVLFRFCMLWHTLSDEERWFLVTTQYGAQAERCAKAEHELL